MATEAQRRGFTLFAVLVIGVATGILVSFLLETDHKDSSAPSTTPGQVGGPGSTDELNGVPVGYAQTEEGAVAAATNFGLVSTNDALWSRDAFIRAMESIAAPGWRDEARRQAENGYEFITQRYGPDADVSGAALRYDVLDFSSEHAVVKLWVLSVISGSKSPTVDEVWGTTIVRLIWIDGDWRVEETTNDTGPAPVDLPGQSPEESANALMKELREYTGAPVP